MEECFLVLQQERSVMEYRVAFETLATPIEEVSKAILEGHFINGLTLEIKVEIHVLKPRGLEQFMELAKSIEEKN